MKRIYFLFLTLLSGIRLNAMEQTESISKKAEHHANEALLQKELLQVLLEIEQEELEGYDSDTEQEISDTPSLQDETKEEIAQRRKVKAKRTLDQQSHTKS